MSSEKGKQVKTRLHARNRNRERYDLAALISAVPALAKHVKPNKHGADSVDFSSPVAVKLLNKALLNHYYGIKNWDFPDENLCPPIPGRADYIHHVADLLSESNYGKVPTGNSLTCLDIGVGASCIYPIIGQVEYGWRFIGSDIDRKSIDAAQAIIDANPSLVGQIECRLQDKAKAIFRGIIDPEEKIDLSICNPPFHSSSEDAQKGSRRKVQNLTGKKVETAPLNFAGLSSEIICEGGEAKFISDMIRESKRFALNCLWFSTLVSKQSHLKGVYKSLENAGPKRVRTLPLGTGNKSSRIVAWTFFSKEEQKQWRETRWRVEG